jgi:two-component sensor histidine kinase
MSRIEEFAAENREKRQLLLEQSEPAKEKVGLFRSIALRCASVCGVVVLATIARLALMPVLKLNAPFSTYFFGVVLVAWYAGLWPALTTVALSAIIGTYFFVPPVHSFLIHRPSDRLNVIVFCVVSIVVSVTSNAQRTARMRAEKEKTIAEEESAQRRKAEEMLRLKQAEVEVLNARLRRAMVETHHRVKNNLQVIASMVELQVSDADETVPADALRRISRHVQVLASIHNILTREVQTKGNLEMVGTQALLGKLRPLLESMVGDRRLTFTMDDFALPIRAGTNLAVLINELVSNAVKHGEGEIELSLAAAADQGRLQVRDRGPGFPPDFDPRLAAHTGLELIESLSHWDLHGELSFVNHPEGGALITVIFPLKLDG